MSRFLHSDLGHRHQGDVVEVTLSGSAANVRLLDNTNFQRYRRGDRHRYHGGLARRSPVRLAIPHTGTWHLVIDMQGLRGTARSAIRIIPAAALRPLPPIHENRRQLRHIAENLAEAAPAIAADTVHQDYDVFISHAGEDKDDIVRPLAHALQQLGVTVWYDEFELRIGDSLRRKIDAGIASSRFGLIVLSPAFFAKSWPQYELDGLVTLAVSGKQVLLPLWHRISKDDVTRHSPSLADKVALRTADYTVTEIAQEIALVVCPPQHACPGGAVVDPI